MLITYTMGATEKSMDDGYELVFTYGVKGNRTDPVNRLDTRRGTFTKDMVMNPPVTFRLTLNESAMNRIIQKAEEIGLQSYPRNYKPPKGAVQGFVTPYTTYDLKLYRDGVLVKHVRMDTDAYSQDPETMRLKELFKLIIDTVQATESYRRSPKPRGGYI